MSDDSSKSDKHPSGAPWRNFYGRFKGKGLRKSQEAYLDEDQDLVRSELIKLREGAKIAFDLGLEPHAGHGLTYDTVKPIAEIPQFLELNIGHFLMGEAMFVGLEAAIKTMRGLIDEARS